MTHPLRTSLRLHCAAPVFVWALAGGSFSSAAEPSADVDVPRIVAPRVAEAPRIDGRLDESLWAQAVPVGPLLQIRPANGEPLTEPTEVLVAYDKDALYIGARLVDGRGAAAITANVLKQGAGLMADDRLAVLLDPAGTGRGAYRFEVNLNGVRNDMLYQNGELKAEWDVIWDTASVLTEDGWSTEIAIPFKTIPNDPDVEAWGFNVSRAIRGKGEDGVWVSRNRSWGPNIAGQLAGIREVDQGMGLDVVPTFGLRQLRAWGPGVATTREEAEPSLDSYYRITPSLSASLTFNTDFSGTASDERQVNLTRFSLFFPEKRDFFLKDADLFDFGRVSGNGQPFFSRKIGLSPVGTQIDVDVGGKLSGRVGGWRVGLMTVRQAAFGSIDESTLSVARIAADVLSESSVGIIATQGDPFSNNSSSLVGADFIYQNSRFPGNRTLTGAAWVQKSSNRGREGDDSAFGLSVDLLDSGGWEQNFGVIRLGEDFQPAMGFVSRPGTIEYEAALGRNHIVDGAHLQSIFAGVEVERVESVDGPLETQLIKLTPFEVEFTQRDRFVPFYRFAEERLTEPFVIHVNRARGTQVVIPVGRYRFQDFGFDFVGGMHRRLVTELNFRHGDFFDGDRLTLGADATWKQSRHLSLRVGYELSDIDLPAGSFTTRIFSGGLDVNFNSRLSWTSLLQYDNVSEQAGLQSLLTWIPRAGRELVAVVNHASQDVDRDGNFRSVAAEYGLRLSYTFRF